MYDELVKKVNAIQAIDTSDLVKKADYNTKIGDIEKRVPDHYKYITTNDFNKSQGAIFDERLKQAESAMRSNLNTVEQHAIQNEKKVEKLQTFDLSFLLVEVT